MESERKLNITISEINELTSTHVWKSLEMVLHDLLDGIRDRLEAENDMNMITGYAQVCELRGQAKALRLCLDLPSLLIDDIKLQQSKEKENDE